MGAAVTRSGEIDIEPPRAGRASGTTSNLASNLPPTIVMSSETISLDASAHPVRAVTIFQSPMAQLTRTFTGVELKASSLLFVQPRAGVILIDKSVP